ncbi:MAG: flagellar export chaperone FlgN [Gemmatimonadota bacterium]
MSAAPAVAGRDHSRAHHVAGLVDALRSEARLLGDLVEVLKHQREAVATEDLQTIDESVYSAQRVLLTLQQARYRRHQLFLLLTGKEDMALRELAKELGKDMTEDLGKAIRILEEGVAELARELEINRRVIQGAFESGDRLLKAISAGPPQSGTYGIVSHRPAGGAGGGLLNTQV